MYDALNQKNKQIDDLRMTSLNNSRKLLTRARHLDAWKQLVFAISQCRIPRIQVALDVAPRNGTGVFGLIEMVDRAAQHAYRVKSYEEADFHRTYLIWKLGGASATKIAHYSLGVPSLDATRRHVMTNPIQASPGFPTMEEIYINLGNAYAGYEAQPGIVLGVTMATGKIKLQEHLRWEACTNMIHGLCREHSGGCTLEFQTMAQADDILACLQSGEVHLALEATVIATLILTGDPKDYTARPFVISGTCKREAVKQHTVLLHQSIKALKQKLPPRLRLYNV